MSGQGRIDNDRAPSHRKPKMPRAIDVAARLEAGETLAVIAACYDRRATTFAHLLNGAGFSSATGLPLDDTPPPRATPRLAFSAQPWADAALCAQTDPEEFYPEKGASTRAAKKVCLTCDARPDCLDYALANDERFGVWGGLSERERRKLKKERAS